MDLEQKRQLNARVCEALGYEIISGEVDNVNPLYNNGHRLKEMDFSGSWAWMGVMVEKAFEKEIYISVEPFRSFTLDYKNSNSYYTNEYRVQARNERSVVLSSLEDENPTFAACIVFLDAQGMDITQYLGEVI
ncbi:hypothetical protein [Brevibacillus porteri]|uniref:hypothetical protein n=1 Tax=Brevibacillus porteri TaxID=2126350 RepID=UPI003628B65F